MRRSLLVLPLIAACASPMDSASAVATTTAANSTGIEPTPTTTPTGDEPGLDSTSTMTTTTTGSTAADGDTTTAGTSSTGEPPPGCGDGVLDPDTEFGDDGYGVNSDMAACTLHCALNVCGDGLLHAGVEQCDQGVNNNDATYAGCGTDCKLTKYCGDSQVQGPEECDFGPDNGSGNSEIGGVGCDATCRFDAKLCFLTSTVFTASSLGSAEQADDLCRAAALAAGFDNPKGFMAWLSDDSSTPATRFTPSQIPYVLPNGVRVANHSKQLLSEGPIAGITHTDKGEDLLQAYVWTGTAPTGILFDSALDCEDWTSASFEHKARVGLSGVDKTNEDEWNVWKFEHHWTSYASFGCDYKYHLFCFEQ